MSLRGSTLDSFKLEMFDAETKEKIGEIDSMAKAARLCGYHNRTTTFNARMYKRLTFDILHKGKEMKVYFKEKT